MNLKNDENKFFFAHIRRGNLEALILVNDVAPNMDGTSRIPQRGCYQFTNLEFFNPTTVLFKWRHFLWRKRTRQRTSLPWTDSWSLPYKQTGKNIGNEEEKESATWIIYLQNINKLT